MLLEGCVARGFQPGFEERGACPCMNSHTRIHSCSTWRMNLAPIAHPHWNCHRVVEPVGASWQWYLYLLFRGQKGTDVVGVR